MKKRIPKIMIAAGIACVVAALSIFIYNHTVSANAARFAEEAVSQLQTHIPKDDTGSGADKDGEEGADKGMESVSVKEHDFIGYISIPALGLNLPVMSEWSYENLDVSPCRYSGAPETDDFVIAAHNYSSHFGFISGLKKGDVVSFTDVRGRQTDYKVELTDSLSPTAVAEMTAGEYDLTLFTCTYSGEARLTVRLDRL